MSQRCQQCGRELQDDHPIYGNLHFCDMACWGLYIGQRLEDELSDLAEAWSYGESDGTNN